MADNKTEFALRANVQPGTAVPTRKSGDACIYPFGRVYTSPYASRREETPYGTDNLVLHPNRFVQGATLNERRNVCVNTATRCPIHKMPSQRRFTKPDRLSAPEPDN